MAMFALYDGTTLNTDYVNVVWPIRNNKFQGCHEVWCYYISVLDCPERFYQQFDMEQSAKDNRSQLLTLMANK